MKCNVFAMLLMGAFTLQAAGCGEQASTPSAPTPLPAVTTNTQPATQPAPTTQPATQPAVDDMANDSKPRLGSGARADDWTEPADRAAFDLRFHFTNQDDEPVEFQQFLGKPMAVTFFFTRCPDPNMCPVIISRLAQLETKLRNEGMTDDVNLLAISYDPMHDSPAVMKAYGSQRGLRFDAATMLRPNNDEYLAMLRELEVNITVGQTGTLGHFIEMILIDRQGRYVRDYRGDIWPNDAVLADLQQLVAEPAEATTPAPPESPDDDAGL